MLRVFHISTRNKFVTYISTALKDRHHLHSPQISIRNASCSGFKYGPKPYGKSRLVNGVKLVYSQPDGAQMAACTILYQAGSRFECGDQLGVTHFLRTCSVASGRTYTPFSKTRVLQQLGSYITVNSDRQSIAFTLRCPVPAFNDVKYYLLDIAGRAAFKQHEIDDRKAQVKLDLETVHPEALVVDLVQKACWGGGLNNSVFCPEERIDSMSVADMEAFTSFNLRADSCSVGSYGLTFEEMMSFAESIEPLRETCHQTRCYPDSFSRRGFEYHDLGPNSATWIAVAVPYGDFNNFTTLLKHSIIAAACGVGNVSGGQHPLDRVAQSPIGFLSADFSMKFKAFNVAYSEMGLFGIVAKAQSSSAAKATSNIVQFMRQIGDLSQEQIQVGKKRLKLGIARHEDDCVRISEGLALQAASDVSLESSAAILNMIDQISDRELSKTAESLAAKCRADKCTNQMGIAVVGDVQAVPHDREILGF